MDLASLAAFVAVAEHGGFSAAAEQLHLTQPAVSKRIAQLEASLDVRLFDRLGRQVVTTEAGRTLLPRARRLLDAADDARRALRAARPGFAGALQGLAEPCQATCAPLAAGLGELGVCECHRTVILNAGVQVGEVRLILGSSDARRSR